MTDIDIGVVQKSVKGDLKSFEKLLKHYENSVYSLCFRFLNNREDALDASQETFIKVYRNLNRYDFGRSLGVWILTIASNTCKDMLRKKKDIYYLDSLILEDNGKANTLEIKDESELPEDNLLRHEQADTLGKALGGLKSELRETVILRDILGLSYAQIATHSDVPLGTVRSRIHRARVELRNIIISKYPELIQGKEDGHELQGNQRNVK